MTSPYREPAPPPPPCRHKRVTKVTLKGGEGIDDAGWSITCNDCGAHRWQFCDRTYSDWRPS